MMCITVGNCERRGALLLLTLLSEAKPFVIQMRWDGLFLALCRMAVYRLGCYWNSSQAEEKIEGKVRKDKINPKRRARSIKN